MLSCFSSIAGFTKGGSLLVRNMAVETLLIGLLFLFKAYSRMSSNAQLQLTEKALVFLKHCRLAKCWSSLVRSTRAVETLLIGLLFFLRFGMSVLENFCSRMSSHVWL